MKKVFLLSMLCLAALTMNAQKCAVLEFRGAQSVSVSDVDGISEMFMTYFHPAGYTMVERAQIDKVISEQGFQRSSLTDAQAVKVGRILNVSKVVVGKVSRLGGQYQVDVRVVDVESGHDAATEGATFSGDYRTNVRNLATKLAGQIAIKPGTTVQPSKPANQDYVDLGLPSGTKWKSTNEDCGHISYNTAVKKYGFKLPSKEQFEELKGKCSWSWTGKGYRVTGPNGNSIFLPAAGRHDVYDNRDYGIGSRGYYWSTTSEGEKYAWDLEFSSNGVSVTYSNQYNYDFSVRLVQD
ncbi:MAG: hypothetical protein II849_10805 [Bacteroidales bacterium]|nr:hypothetical protein [Bacteroidales bacterium]